MVVLLLAAMDNPIAFLPNDLHRFILSKLSLFDALACAAASRRFYDALFSPPRPPRPPRRLVAVATGKDLQLRLLDPSSRRWIRCQLPSIHGGVLSPVGNSGELLLFWAEIKKSFILYNPITRAHRALPQLHSSTWQHAAVIAVPGGGVIVLTDLDVFSFTSSSNTWFETPHNLPSKPNSTVLINGENLYTLCDVGVPWQKKWKLFRSSPVTPEKWAAVEPQEWGEILDILRQPLLLSSSSPAKLLMIGGLKPCYNAVDSKCSALIVLRLDLQKMEWEEAARMPPEMYELFSGDTTVEEVKVFGGNGMVWFSGKKVKCRMVLWEERVVEEKNGISGDGGRWSWVEDVPGDDEGAYSGLVFYAGLNELV